jgi:DNA-binding response OmpR family regulator
MAKILVVEDDKKLSAAVCDCLLLEKHTVEAPYSVANQFWHSRKIT